MKWWVTLKTALVFSWIPVSLGQFSYDAYRGYKAAAAVTRQFPIPVGGYTPLRLPIPLRAHRPNLISLTGGGLAPIPVNPMNALGDLLFTTTMGLPLMGLMALSGLILLPFFGVNMGAIGLGSIATTATGLRNKYTYSKYGVKKSRRLDETLDEMEPNAAQLMLFLEKVFLDYGIRSPACKSRAVCEYSCQRKHDMPLGVIASDIDVIFRKREEMEETEKYPVSKFLLSTYLRAYEKGHLECGQCMRSYMQCPNSPLDNEDYENDEEDKSDKLQSVEIQEDPDIENEVQDSIESSEK